MRALGDSGGGAVAVDDAAARSAWIDLARAGWLAELCAAAQRAGVRKLIAVIGDSANTGSVGLHRATGFDHVGTIGACGFKFNRWLDIVLMEKALGAGATTLPANP